jgi:hypothetical protein
MSSHVELDLLSQPNNLFILSQWGFGSSTFFWLLGFYFWVLQSGSLLMIN